MTDAAEKTASPWSLGRHTGLVLVLSCVINLLGLVGAIYMMQVYDRVLSSGSVPTLIGLSIIALILYVFYGFLEYFRSEYLSAHGENFADKHAHKAFNESLEGHARDINDSDRRWALEDLNIVRKFLTSKGYSAIFDVIWMPIFLLFIFSLHVTLGVTALIATIGLVAMALINERTSRKRIEDESSRVIKSRRWIANIHRHAHLVKGNGMGSNMAQTWMKTEKKSRLESLSFSAISSKFSVTSKTIRMIIQSMILGLGGFLAIQGHISPGAMIAASIVFTRTLAPVERLLANFALFIKARQSWSRIKTWIYKDTQDNRIGLPAPHKSLQTDIRYLVPPGAKRPVLQNVKLDLQAGDVLGILGPSGSGKTSLSKALAGAWEVQSGHVAMDGAAYIDWPQHQLGAAIGYMAQECELFDGTIAENICGFTPEVDDNSILYAAMSAHAHDMITGLPNGYNTLVGPNGIALSAGQRQRINLARALFGNPFIVVLDEPNSNLDEQGERALLDAIKNLKENNKIVVIVAHRRTALKHANKLCVIKDGTVLISGPAKHVIDQLSKAKKTTQSPQIAAQAPVSDQQIQNPQVTAGVQAVPTGLNTPVQPIPFKPEAVVTSPARPFGQPVEIKHHAS